MREVNKVFKGFNEEEKLLIREHLGLAAVPCSSKDFQILDVQDKQNTYIMFLDKNIEDEAFATRNNEFSKFDSWENTISDYEDEANLHNDHYAYLTHQLFKASKDLEKYKSDYPHENIDPEIARRDLNTIPTLKEKASANIKYHAKKTCYLLTLQNDLKSKDKKESRFWLSEDRILNSEGMLAMPTFIIFKISKKHALDFKRAASLDSTVLRLDSFLKERVDFKFPRPVVLSKEERLQRSKELKYFRNVTKKKMQGKREKVNSLTL